MSEKNLTKSVTKSKEAVTKEPMTREERRKMAKAKKEKKASEKGKREKRGRIRLIPVWLKVLISICLFAVSLALGLMFGYGFIGDGEPRDALNLDTWYHIYDIIFEDTEYDRDITGLGK